MRWSALPTLSLTETAFDTRCMQRQLLLWAVSSLKWRRFPPNSLVMCNMKEYFQCFGSIRWISPLRDSQLTFFGVMSVVSGLRSLRHKHRRERHLGSQDGHPNKVTFWQKRNQYGKHVFVSNFGSFKSPQYMSLCRGSSVINFFLEGTHSKHPGMLSVSWTNPTSLHDQPKPPRSCPVATLRPSTKICNNFLTLKTSKLDSTSSHTFWKPRQPNKPTA